MANTPIWEVGNQTLSIMAYKILLRQEKLSLNCRKACLEFHLKIPFYKMLEVTCWFEHAIQFYQKQNNEKV